MSRPQPYDVPIPPSVLEAVLEVGRAVAAEAGMAELLPLIVRMAAKVGCAQKAALCFVGETEDRLTMRAWLGIPDGQAQPWSERVGHGLLGRTVQAQRPLAVAAIPENEREDFLGEGDALAIPLVAERRPKGVLMLARAESFRPEERPVLEALCVHFAAAIDNVWLYERYRALNSELEATVEVRTRELRQAQAQLLQREKMAALGQLTAGVAHEINNPLAFVSSNLDILESKVQRLARLRSLESQADAGSSRSLLEVIEGWRSHERYQDEIRSFLERLPRDPEAQVAEARSFMAFVREQDAREEGSCRQTLQAMERFVGKTREGVERIKGIVQDLRAFSRLDVATFDRVDLHDGLERTLTLLGHLFRGTDIALAKDYQLDVPVPCTPARLNQVFMNLLVNAVQALKGRGEIRLSTRREGDLAVIEVHDTGCGIPQADLERIFEPFYTTKPVGEGTGLGLSLSYGIVTDHGGKLEVASTPGVGTTFRVVLPLDPPRKQQEEPSQ